MKPTAGARARVKQRYHNKMQGKKPRDPESSFNGTQRDSEVMKTFPAYSSETGTNPELFYKDTEAAKQLAHEVGVDAPTKKFTKQKEQERLEAIARNKRNARCWPRFVNYVQKKLPNKQDPQEIEESDNAEA